MRSVDAGWRHGEKNAVKCERVDERDGRQLVDCPLRTRGNPSAPTVPREVQRQIKTIVVVAYASVAAGFLQTSNFLS